MISMCGVWYESVLSAILSSLSIFFSPSLSLSVLIAWWLMWPESSTKRWTFVYDLHAKWCWTLLRDHRPNHNLLLLLVVSLKWINMRESITKAKSNVKVTVLCGLYHNEAYISEPMVATVLGNAYIFKYKIQIHNLYRYIIFLSFLDVLWLGISKRTTKET